MVWRWQMHRWCGDSLGSPWKWTGLQGYFMKFHSFQGICYFWGGQDPWDWYIQYLDLAPTQDAIVANKGLFIGILLGPKNVSRHPGGDCHWIMIFTFNHWQLLGRGGLSEDFQTKPWIGFGRFWTDFHTQLATCFWHVLMFAPMGKHRCQKRIHTSHAISDWNGRGIHQKLCISIDISKQAEALPALQHDDWHILSSGEAASFARPI